MLPPGKVLSTQNCRRVKERSARGLVHAGNIDLRGKERDRGAREREKREEREREAREREEEKREGETELEERKRKKNEKKSENKREKREEKKRGWERETEEKIDRRRGGIIKLGYIGRWQREKNVLCLFRSLPGSVTEILLNGQYKYLLTAHMCSLSSMYT